VPVSCPSNPTASPTPPRPLQELAAALQAQRAASADAAGLREELAQAQRAAVAAAEKTHNDQLVLAKEIKRLRGQVGGRG
jgi:hypothetical protein